MITSSHGRRIRWIAAAVVLPITTLAAAACSGKNAPSAAGASRSPRPSISTASGSASPTVTRTVPSQRPAAVESNPPGDIPDNIAYISYHSAPGRYTFVHPEGWAAIQQGVTVTFTDKLNGITATAVPAGAVPTVASAGRDIAQLRTTQPAFELRGVKAITLPGGSGVLIVFRRNSAPDPVTGKVFRDEVNRYEIYGHGREVILDLYGAVGSDNVDPYTKISRSLRLS